MLVSTRSKYGLKIMYELALRYGGEPVFLKDIARAHRISEKYLSKLVIPLRGVSLVTSYRGAHGGYSLARDPRTITLREIVQALEGDISATGNPRRSRGADDGYVHPADAVWGTLEKAVSDALEKVTLDSILRGAREGILNYQI
ncbi:MAG: Rrf2 family transcriptional regulator [Spirochaetia bacterium]|jgi:Rrf2 family cysteine metabolism transcriptional repressor